MLLLAWKLRGRAPPGERLLAVVSWPSLLDFKRNQIWIMDWPGMMGPAGMPLGGDAEAWDAYLTKASVRYVVYS